MVYNHAKLIYNNYALKYIKIFIQRDKQLSR